MAVTVQMQFESVVTELYQDTFVGSAIENGTTIIQFDLRKRDWQGAWGTTATICWRQEPYHVDIHELSTFHNPIKYRFIVAQGSYLNDQNQRVYFTPDIQGVSTSQHMSKSIIRLACYLAVGWGVSLRHVALLLSALFLMPMTKSSIKRCIDAIGSNLPTPEQMLQQLLTLLPVTACHLDGYYPLGTDHCVMVVKDEHDRILITHEAASENGDEAKQFRQRLKDHGLKVTAAFSDDSQSFPEALKAVYPSARFPADHFHTVKNVWGPLKKALLSYRRQGKASGEAQQEEAGRTLAKKLWTWRWSLLKKPSHLSAEEKQALAALESEEAGFGHSFRHMIRQGVNLFDHTHSTHSEAPTATAEAGYPSAGRPAAA